MEEIPLLSTSELGEKQFFLTERAIEQHNLSWDRGDQQQHAYHINPSLPTPPHTATESQRNRLSFCQDNIMIDDMPLFLAQFSKPACVDQHASKTHDAKHLPDDCENAYDLPVYLGSSTSCSLQLSGNLLFCSNTCCGAIDGIFAGIGSQFEENLSIENAHQLCLDGEVETIEYKDVYHGYPKQSMMTSKTMLRRKG